MLSKSISGKPIIDTDDTEDYPEGNSDREDTAGSSNMFDGKTNG